MQVVEVASLCMFYVEVNDSVVFRFALGANI